MNPQTEDILIELIPSFSAFFATLFLVGGVLTIWHIESTRQMDGRPPTFPTRCFNKFRDSLLVSARAVRDVCRREKPAEFPDYIIDYNEVGMSPPDQDMPKIEYKRPAIFIDTPPSPNELRAAAGFPLYEHRHFQLYAGRTWEYGLGPCYRFVCRDLDCPTEWKASIKFMWGFVPPEGTMVGSFYWRDRAEYIRHWYTPLRVLPKIRMNIKND